MALNAKMTNYTKGVKLERDVIQIFKDAGFQAARTAGSHSPFDVILWKQTPENEKVCFVAFVQCKVSKLKGKAGIADPEQLSKLL